MIEPQKNLREDKNVGSGDKNEQSKYLYLYCCTRINAKLTITREFECVIIEGEEGERKFDVSSTTIKKKCTMETVCKDMLQ